MLDTTIQNRCAICHEAQNVTRAITTYCGIALCARHLAVNYRKRLATRHRLQEANEWRARTAWYNGFPETASRLGDL